MTESIEYRGYDIEIDQDVDPLDPCDDFDMLGIMVCWHNRYTLGHKQPKDDPNDFFIGLATYIDYTVADRIEYWENGNGYTMILNNFIGIKNQWEHISNQINKKIKSLVQKTIEKNYIILPLYLYDHSGITISTGPFNCPFDSGQIGYIYVPIKDIKKEWNWKLLTKKRRLKIESILKSEVKIYDDFLTGNVFGYNVNDPYTGDSIDSCWGFFGDYEKSGLLEMAKNAIDCHIDKVNEERSEMQLIETGDMSEVMMG